MTILSHSFLTTFFSKNTYLFKLAWDSLALKELRWAGIAFLG